MVAANVQYLFVKFLGENTFNYIIGGLLSLLVGACVCSLLGTLLFIFVRGWHMAALAYSKKIIKKGYPALEAGMTVFKAHFTSFAATYGIGMMVKKATHYVTDNLWDLLKDVPYLGSLKRFADNPIVTRLASDILDTAFDALVYYEIKYTEPGIGDDAEVIGIALRKYFLSLPQLIIGSLSAFMFLYIVPKCVAAFVLLMVLLQQGIVAGILIGVLLFPLFYVLQHSVFEPLETIILISGFAKQCALPEEETSVYSTIVDSLLEEMGFSDFADTGEDASEEQEETEELPVATGESSAANSIRQNTPKIVQDNPRRKPSEDVQDNPRRRSPEELEESPPRVRRRRPPQPPPPPPPNDEVINVEPTFEDESPADLASIPLGQTPFSGTISTEVDITDSGGSAREDQLSRLAQLARRAARVSPEEESDNRETKGEDEAIPLSPLAAMLAMSGDELDEDGAGAPDAVMPAQGSSSFEDIMGGGSLDEWL